MDAIKKHAFTIILAATTLAVTGGTLLAITLPYWSRNRQLINTNEGLAGSLKNLERAGQPLKAVDSVKAAAEQVKTRVQATLDTAGQLSRQDRKSLSMYVEALGKAIDLFPVNRQDYETGLVAHQFRPVYERAMRELLDKLDGALPPSMEEVTAMAQRVDILLRQQATDANASPLIEEILPLGISAAGPGAGAPMGGSMPMEPGGMRGFGEMGEPGSRSFRRPGLYAGPSAGVSGVAVGAGAQVEALKLLQLERISTRPIYAERNSFYWYPTVFTHAPVPIEDMWKSMVCLWIHDYVVERIQATNAQAMTDRGQDPDSVTIATAAIKRLTRVSMGVNGDALSALYAGEVGGTTGGWRAEMYEPGEMGGMGRMGGFAPPGAGTGAGGAAATLTGHECNTRFDVVRFGLSLIVRVEDLPLLLKMLQSRPGYTVLKVDLAQVEYAATISPMRTGSETGAYPVAAGGMAPPSIDETAYYYGTDRVLAVQLDMEARLDAAWERLLMPPEMLRRLPPSALRPEDSAAMGPADTMSPMGPTVPMGPGGPGGGPGPGGSDALDGPLGPRSGLPMGS